MKLTKDEVRQIADLAYLELTEEEIECFRKELSSILDYVDLLKEVDISGVEIFSKPIKKRENIFREDRILKDNCLSLPEVLANAPFKDGGFIKTRAVL